MRHQYSRFCVRQGDKDTSLCQFKYQDVIAVIRVPKDTSKILACSIKMFICISSDRVPFH